MVECPPLVVEDELDQHQHQRPGKNNFATCRLSSLVQSCKNSGSSRGSPAAVVTNAFTPIE